MTNDFYDPMAPFYHLVHGDWETSIKNQAKALDSIIKAEWGNGISTILDVTCGIGTQAIGLAEKGYRVTGSDLSGEAVRRAQAEADKRGLDIDFHVGDMCKVGDERGGPYDLVMSADNAVTHLLSEEAILGALKSFHKACKPGGGCLVSMRDYDKEGRGGVQFHPFGVRDVDGVRWSVYQVWDWRPDDSGVYDFSMYFTADDGKSELKTHVMRSSFLALSPSRMMALFEEAGFHDVKRTDGVFFQPVITGTK
ncbi:class I SAM-dependent methyltransferase [Kordiimonas marina]|uniref:class I SAM-dependent methyltransferase n=1 Tax=Kordiimonas marina TaxID=2872312 RepID=UPI001FF367C4|nr:class I SAM-dependent methyltransferase [Kordiimonas marina]MCJ9427555.1 class I SAM-dependent methyltransferase [Kordiimonas marina]